MDNNFNVPGFPDVQKVGTDKKVNNRNAKGQLKATDVLLIVLLII